MEETTYSIQKPKAGCMVYGALIFCILTVIFTLVYLFLNFSFGTLTTLFVGGTEHTLASVRQAIDPLVAALLVGGTCFLIAHMIINEIFYKSELIVNDEEIEAINLGNSLSFSRTVLWNDIVAIWVDDNQIAKKKILMIESPKLNPPIHVPEDMVENFERFSSEIIRRFESAKGIGAKNIHPDIKPKLQTKKIGFDDLEAIKEYCRYIAQQWWQDNNLETATCDGCNAPVSKGTGIIIGSYLYCGSCGNEKFSPSMAPYLRSDPNFYGRGMLEKAREYANTKRR